MHSMPFIPAMVAMLPEAWVGYQIQPDFELVVKICPDCETRSLALRFAKQLNVRPIDRRCYRHYQEALSKQMGEQP